MKQILLSLFCLSLGSFTIAQEVIFQPQQPNPGAKVHFTYDPTDGPFGENQDFEAAVYIYADEFTADNIDLVWNKGVYTGSFETPKSTKAVFLSFFNEEKDLVENNGGTGYSLLMYENEKVVEGGYAAKAKALGNYSRLLKINFDPALSLEYLKKEFELYSQSKEQNLDAYGFAAKYAKDEVAMKDLREVISKISTDKNVTEERLVYALYGASSIGDDELLKKLDEEVKKLYPEGRRAAELFAETFYATTDLEEKVAIFEEYLENFSEAEKEIKYAQNMASRLAMSYGRSGNWTEFEKQLTRVENLDQKANVFNEIAWIMSGEGLDSEAKDIEKALMLSKKSLELTEESKKTLSTKPPLYTPQQWKRIKEGNYAMFADTYALLLYKNGNYEEAYKYQKICCETYQYLNADMNHRLSVYLEKTKGKSEALEFLEEMIVAGNANAVMKENYQALFLATGGTKEAYQKKINSFQQEALKELRKELAEKMISEKASDFTLFNTKGEKIALEEMRGKVVILDFWATWCGPCIASFPGMQKAVKKYQDDENVAFLFVNTWENGDNKTQKASEFMEKKGYDFNIVMDTEDVVVADFGVDGIPTKFVIDKTGRVRFKSVGFQADEDALVNELSVMIELASEKSGEGLE